MAKKIPHIIKYKGLYVHSIGWVKHVQYAHTVYLVEDKKLAHIYGKVLAKWFAKEIGGEVEEL